MPYRIVRIKQIVLNPAVTQNHCGALKKTKLHLPNANPKPKQLYSFVGSGLENLGNLYFPLPQVIGVRGHGW